MPKVLCFELSVADIIIVRQGKGLMDWTEVLKVENGGPGDSPGREEAVRLALEDTKARYRKHGQKKAKGSSSRKTEQVSRDVVRAKGL